MPNGHPAAIAAQVAMLDHMLDGRFIFGISPGGLASDAEVFGNLDADRQAMFLECIDMVLEIWKREAPYNIEGKFWKVSTARTQLTEIGQGIMPKPLQRPHPPIVVTAVAPFSKGVTEAAARGWDPISANFLMPEWVKTHWPRYAEGCARAGRPSDPANWRVAKSIFVADDLTTARAYATGPDSPYRFYYKQLLTKMRKHNRLNLFKPDPNMADSDVTLDMVCDRLVIWGTPDKVADEILAFRDEVGDFGKLLYAGKDWADPALGRRSMVLLAEQVLPQVNAALPTAAAAE
jgi:alkanesulfonate monooxygenase SsuD/methylene tetrahydromethanopterin reductase-like flavin-dependent oxidoreductase (luciferase family)